MTIALSVILPAYNEALRLPAFLSAVRTYLEENYPEAYEVIVVDDGSHDDTAAMLAEIGRDWPALMVLSHPVNRG